jgi:hypothetical protein
VRIVAIVPAGARQIFGLWAINRFEIRRSKDWRFETTARNGIAHFNDACP